jgi:hypothetical protein
MSEVTEMNKFKPTIVYVVTCVCVCVCMSVCVKLVPFLQGKNTSPHRVSVSQKKVVKTEGN